MKSYLSKSESLLKSIFLGLIINILGLLTTNAFANEPLFVGVLESFDKKEWSQEFGKESINPRIRIAFTKDKNNWVAIKTDFDTLDQLHESVKNYPKQIIWNVVNGKNFLGTLTTTQYTPNFYSDVGIQKIQEKNIPNQFQLSPSKNLQFPLRKMDHRPLITISKISTPINLDDPEGWVVSKPINNEIKQLQANLGINIKILESYRAKNHGLLICVMKNKIPQWFYIDKNSTLRFIDAGMNLIEKIDIDHSGKTEFIFLYSDPNSEDANANGYILFYDDFKKSARFVWHNH